MFFQRIKTNGLGHNAYLLGCGDGLAVLVDPRRDVDEYLEIARANNLRVSHCLETHRQEDFEFGSRAVAEITGARIVTGIHELFVASDIRVKDGEEFKIGRTRFVALATPGHTPESMSYAVYAEDSGEKCWAVFTGDALFVGSTGRTDLADPARTAENAGILYDSIHEKLAPLGAQTIVLPAHGSGSACGGNISERDDTTLGIEFVTNPVFKNSREEFIALKVQEHLPRPPYFSHMEQVNPGGGRPLPPPRELVLAPKDFHARMQDGLVIDTRPPDAFAAAHIPGSYNIWLEGLSTFGGWVANATTDIFLVVAQPQQVATAITALARIGIDSVKGVLVKGVEGWREHGLPIDKFGTTSAHEASQWLQAERLHILDVRDDMEWNEKHIPAATHIYVGHLEENLPQVDKTRRIVVHCSVGHRSGLACSMLARHGFTHVFNMLGGIKAWENFRLPLVTPQPTTRPDRK